MNKVWDTHYTFNDGTKKNKRYIVGDLCVINDKICGMVFARERYLSAMGSILKESFDYSQTDTLYYYQEGDKVYCLAEDGSTEMLMFDYGLKEGDAFVNSNGEQFHVIETDFFKEYENHFMRLADSVSPKTLRLRSDDGRQDQVWIEGFGEAQCGIVPLYMVENLKKIDSPPIHSITPNNYYNDRDIWSGLNDGMFDVNDDDYKLIHFVPVEDKEGRKDLEYTFVGDTLCVTGNFDMQNYNTATCFECMITEDNTIAFNIWPYNRVPITGDFRIYVDVKIPGFKPGTYTIDGKTLVRERNDNDYIPFVEEGKVWKVGNFWDGSKQTNELEFYCIEGDTIVGNIACKQWLRQTMNYEERKTEYIGAVYERDGRVYEFLPGRDEALMLYDFATPTGEWVEAYDAYQDCVVKCCVEKRDTVNVDGNLLRQTTVWTNPNNETTVIYNAIWSEGIGNNKRPNYNSYSEWGGDYHWLMSCQTANDVLLYQNNSLQEDVTSYWSDDDNEAKKQKIDFTHVIKTKPTSPQPVTTNISLLWGEYSDAVLNIDFEGMSGRYAISVRNDDEQEDRFAASHETINLQSLDINLAGYPKGQYTVTVENDDEYFTAHFSLPLINTGVHSIDDEPSTTVLYDLSGRRVSPSSALKGVYIQNGKKVVRH